MWIGSLPEKNLLHYSLCNLAWQSALQKDKIMILDRIMVPREVHVRIPGTCSSVHLQGKRDLRMEDYPGLSGWAQSNHMGECL
jgi:hypothetical protein